MDSLAHFKEYLFRKKESLEKLKGTINFKNKIDLSSYENEILELEELLNDMEWEKERVTEQLEITETMMEDSKFHYNFASNLINMRILSLNDVEKYFTRFGNDCVQLCTYHNDYSIEEMLGVMKFLRSFISFNETIQEYNDLHGVNIGRSFVEKIRYLEYKLDKQKLGILESHDLDHLMGFYKNRMDKYIKTRKEY